MRTALVLCSLALTFALAYSRADAAAPSGTPARPVLVELFTSQGCSSCPPADRLLASLAARPLAERTVIPLAFHVDYWNSLGWQDPFSSAEWSRRQERYGARLGGGIYTPEAVVAGKAGVVGNDRGGIDRLVAAAAAEPSLASVTVTRGAASDGVLPVTVRAERRATAGASGAEVLVALYQNGLETPVKSGENASRTLRDERVVRRLERALLLPAGGGSGTATVALKLDPRWPAAALGVVAFVQEPQSLRVLAVAEAP